jgi:hypothetical protein
MFSLDPVIVVALIFFVGTALNALVSFRSPIIVARMNAAQRHAERQEDHARQDKVREQVAEAARLQVEQNKKVAVSTAATNEKLEEIHVAVNSNLDQAQREALEAKDMLVLVMEEIIELKRSNGVQPSEATMDTLQRTRQRALELRNRLYR